MPPVEWNTARFSSTSGAPTPADRPYPKVSYSTLSTDAIAQVAVQDYGFSDSVKCALFQRGTNDTYRLSTPDKRYALRVARTNVRSNDALLGELSALKHLGSKGAPVALPVARSDGDWITDIHAPEGLRKAVVFDWATGHTLKCTDPTQALDFGRLLAQMHNASDDFPADPARPVMSAEFLLEGPSELIRARLARQPAATRNLDILVDRTRTRLSQATAQLRDWGLCHGDVHANNARISDDRIVLFDFDFCATGWRLYDLAAYRGTARRQGVEELAWSPFVEGYLQARPAAVDSLPFLGLFMILHQLWTIAQCIALSKDTGMRLLSNDVFDNLVAYCEKIESDIDSRPDRPATEPSRRVEARG